VVAVRARLQPDCSHSHLDGCSVLISAATRSAASRSIPSVTWLWRSRVIVLVEWPSRS